MENETSFQQMLQKQLDIHLGKRNEQSLLSHVIHKA